MGCGTSQQADAPKRTQQRQDAADKDAADRGFELKKGRKDGRFIVKTKKGGAAAAGLTSSGHTTAVDFNGISMGRVDAK